MRKKERVKSTIMELDRSKEEPSWNNYFCRKSGLQACPILPFLWGTAILSTPVLFFHHIEHNRKTWLRESDRLRRIWYESSHWLLTVRRWCSTFFAVFSFICHNCCSRCDGSSRTVDRNDSSSFSQFFQITNGKSSSLAKTIARGSLNCIKYAQAI